MYLLYFTLLIYIASNCLTTLLDSECKALNVGYILNNRMRSWRNLRYIMSGVAFCCCLWSCETWSRIREGCRLSEPTGGRGS
jgi:hypothetical protein